MDNKPNLFIAGFARAGSTALASYLSQHPQIFVPAIKEPHFFYPFNKAPQWMNLPLYKYNLKEYNNLYKHAISYKYRVDASVSYSFYNGIAQRIKEYNPSSFIILIIRDGLKRIVSAYNFTYPYHKMDDISQWIEMSLRPQLDTFLMYEKVVEYHKIFGDKLIVLHHNDLKNKPQEILTSLFDRLSLEPIKIKEEEKNAPIVSINDSKIKKDILSFIVKIYLNVRRFAKLLGLENEYTIFMSSLRQLFLDRDIIDNNTKLLIERVPADISNIVNEDYTKTVEYITYNMLLLKRSSYV